MGVSQQLVFFPRWYLVSRASLFKPIPVSYPLFPRGGPSPAQTPISLVPCPPSQAGTRQKLKPRPAADPSSAASAGARRGPLLPPASSDVTSPTPGPLPSRGRLPESSGGEGRQNALPHIAKRASRVGRKEPLTEGAEDGRRKEELQQRHKAHPVGGTSRLRPEAPPTYPAPSGKRAVAGPERLSWRFRSRSPKRASGERWSWAPAPAPTPRKRQACGHLSSALGTFPHV